MESQGAKPKEYERNAEKLFDFNETDDICSPMSGNFTLGTWMRFGAEFDGIISRISPRITVVILRRVCYVYSSDIQNEGFLFW